MTKLEEILERDQWTCHGCGMTATKILLSYNVPGRELEAYPDFAWVSVCPACAAEGNDGPPPNELLDWEQTAKALYELTTLNGATWLLRTIHDAQTRTVDLATIIEVIEGIALIPSEELG